MTDRTLPQNPNTRKPYSDVSMELTYYMGRALEFMGVDWAKMKEQDRKLVGVVLNCLDRAMLRTKAVLDPIVLTDAEWELTKENAYELEGKLRDRQPSVVEQFLKSVVSKGP